MKKKLPILQVSCALITHQGLMLAARRSSEMSEAGNWEFPGGKLKVDESPEACLLREIREELGIRVCVKTALKPVRERQSERILELLPFHCSLQDQQPQKLEHAELCWDTPEQLLRLNWIPADLMILQNWLKNPLPDFCSGHPV